MIKEALNEGRKRQSPLTGFLHYCFEEKTSRDVIPVYENLVFILALCKSNQADLILEGRDLFLRLYEYFRVPGAFPVYLHEWPQIRKPLLAVRMLIAVLKIHEGYRHVWGNKGREALDDVIGRLKQSLLEMDLPPLQKFQMEVITGQVKRSEFAFCRSTMDWSEILTVASYLDGPIQLPWHSHLNVFAGEYGHELVRTTLIDLFYGKKPKEGEITYLYGALVEPFEWISQVPVLSTAWERYVNERCLFSTLKEFTPTSQKVSPGFHLFHLATEKGELVCQNTDLEYTATFEEGALIAEFTMHEPRQVDLFMTYQKGGGLFGDDGQRTTFFEAGDRVCIGGFQIEYFVQGEGRVCGHFLRGDRRSRQTSGCGLDWQMNFEALEVAGPLVIRLIIRYTHNMVVASSESRTV